MGLSDYKVSPSIAVSDMGRRTSLGMSMLVMFALETTSIAQERAAAVAIHPSRALV